MGSDEPRTHQGGVEPGSGIAAPKRVSEVSLALGGGGGKGVVHVGVLQAIEQESLRIASIVGTSIGAVWGALLAKTIVDPLIPAAEAQPAAVTTIQKLAYQLKFSDYSDLDVLSLFAKAFVKGNKFEDWLGTMLWNDTEHRFLSFHDVDFDLTVTVTDALTGESILCNRAKTPHLAIAKAVRASMSIQGVFRPVFLDIPGPNGQMRAVKCWDGGTTGNCRFDIPLAAAPGRPVIASSLTYRGEVVDVDKGVFRAPWRLSRTRDHTISILMRENEQVLVDCLDPGHQKVLVIRPPLSSLSTFDLSIPTERKAAAIAAAREYAQDEVQRFRQQVGF